MNLIIAFIFFVLVLFLAILPYFLMYLLSDFFALLLNYIFKYRKKIILENLKLCFPEKNNQEIRYLVSNVYKNLTDNILEGIKAFTMSKRQLVKRHKISNVEILNELKKANKSIIAVAGHYNNWEWGSLSAKLQTDYNIVGFYKPLSNSYINSFVRWSRERCGTFLASIEETSSTFEKFKDIPTAFLMAADQSPGKKYLDKSFWIQFLGRDTAFLHGPEKHAKNNNYPVVYIDVQRVKRGFYTVQLSILAENPAELPEGEITSRFASKLESVIQDKPANWLWSHNRWKLKR